MKNNEQKNILIVDDESEMRIALETTLKREKFQLTCAEDGKQGNPEDYRDYQVGKYRNMVEQTQAASLTGNQ